MLSASSVARCSGTVPQSPGMCPGFVLRFFVASSAATFSFANSRSSRVVPLAVSPCAVSLVASHCCSSLCAPSWVWIAATLRCALSFAVSFLTFLRSFFFALLSLPASSPESAFFLLSPFRLSLFFLSSAGCSFGLGLGATMILVFEQQLFHRSCFCSLHLGWDGGRRPLRRELQLPPPPPWDEGAVVALESPPNERRLERTTASALSIPRRHADSAEAPVSVAI